MSPLRAAWSAYLTGAAAMAVLTALVILVTNRLTDGFDAALTRFVLGAADLDPIGLLRPITELGSTPAITALALLLLVGLAATGNPRLGLLAAGTIGLAALLSTAAKEALARARPEALHALLFERGFSFPSGHALLSTTAYGILSLLVLRSSLARGVRVAIVAALAAVVALVGVSRVYLGVHHPTDVIAGWAGGVLAVTVFGVLSRQLRRQAEAPSAGEPEPPS